MEIKFVKCDYKGAFGTQPYNVFVKVRRDKPEYWPWELVLFFDFYIESYPDSLGGGWYLRSCSDKADDYLKSRGHGIRKRIETKKELAELIKTIIPDWIGKDYSGGHMRDFVFSD